MNFYKKRMLILLAACSMSAKTECAGEFEAFCVGAAAAFIEVWNMCRNPGKDILAGTVTGAIAPIVGQTIYKHTAHRNAGLLGIAGTIALGNVMYSNGN